MKTFLTLMLLLAPLLPAHAATKKVIVHIDNTPSGEKCPLYVRETGNPARCTNGVSFQSDALCLTAVDKIEWTATGSTEIQIVPKSGFVYPFDMNCSTTVPSNKVTCDVSVGEGSYSYNIKSANCFLDPRIIITNVITSVP